VSAADCGDRNAVVAQMMKFIRHDRQYSTYIGLHNNIKEKVSKKHMLKTVKIITKNTNSY